MVVRPVALGTVSIGQTTAHGEVQLCARKEEDVWHVEGAGVCCEGGNWIRKGVFRWAHDWK